MVTNPNFNLQPAKKVANDPRIVHIVNLHDKMSYIDGWDGEEYEFPPMSKMPVPIAMAKNCLGDPEAEDWGLETVRLKSRYGFDRDKGKYSNMYWEQLIASGKVHCPEFGTTHIKKVNNMVRDVKDRVIARPITGSETFAEGAVPLSKDEFEKFRNNVASLDLSEPAEYEDVDAGELNALNMDELFSPSIEEVQSFAPDFNNN